MAKSGIVFRASFEQPIGPRNPAGIKLPGPIQVEIFQAKVGPPAEWKARSVTRNEFKEISAQSTPGTLKRQIEGIHFERQLTEWEAFDAVGKLREDEWSTDSKGHVFITPIRAARLAEKEVHERAERARQQTEIYERDFKPQ